jgi:hypothetical protein
MAEPIDPNHEYGITLPIGKFLKEQFAGSATLGNGALSYNYAELYGVVGEVFNLAIKDAIRPYVGKPLNEIPDNITIKLLGKDLPGPWEPFAEIIPGIPNIGVNPVTGGIDPLSLLNDTPLAAIGNFFTFLFSAQGLALLAGIVLLYLGYKSIIGANVSVEG